MTERKAQKGHDLDDVPDAMRSNRVKPSDIVDLYDIPRKWARVRPFGPWYLYAGHWVKTKSKEGKIVSFYTPCCSFDPDTGKRDASKHCAWCSHDDTDAVRFSVDYYTNIIVRGLQKSRPEELPKPTKAEVKSGFKDKDSETWTPVRALRLPGGPIRDVKELKQLNVHENAEGDSIAYPVSHAKFGCDIMLKKDPDAAPAKKYAVNKGDPKPLTKEEKAYLPYDLSGLQAVVTEEEVEKEYQSWLNRNGGAKKKKKSEDDDDEDDTPPKKSKAKSEDFDDDDDEDTPPKKAKKKKPVVDDDDDDEEEDEDEDDDEPPVKKGKRKPVDDDDDEDDEPAPPKKKPAAKKKKPVVEDDEEDDDEEDDDEPPPKKAKKKPVVDDNDDDDEDDDEPPPRKKSKKVVEDDDDDEPPVKKGKKKPAPSDDDEDEDEPPRKKAKKKAPVDDDDDL